MGALAVVAGCSGPPRAQGGSGEVGERDPFGRADAPTRAGEASAESAEPIPLGPITKGSFREHPAGQAFVFDGDPAKPAPMDLGRAEALGYAVIDLGNGWVPYIFSEKTAGVEDQMRNAYRQTYVGLANDRIDSYGDELEPWNRNYLELYGIPPSLSVIKEEWDRLERETLPCLEAAGFDPTVFERFEGTIAFSKSGAKKRNRGATRYGAQVRKAMARAKLDFDAPEDHAIAADHPKIRPIYQKWRSFQDEVDVIDHAQRRFRCERLFNSHGGEGDFVPGVFDNATTHALANFEQKHDLMGWGHFKRDNLAFLAMHPSDAVHARLLRAVQERVVASAGIVEDGSAARYRKDFRYEDASGQEHALRDLVTEFSQAAVEALGLGTPDEAYARLQALSDLGAGDFEDLLVAVRMPALPPYYAPNMDFQVVIDRGDVWYDFPYDDEGNPISQPRRRYPHLTLFVNYEGQKIPLVHWRTTIGSWRTELDELGEVMMKYKNSDVGARVWKDIVAAPVWIPPTSTPTAALVRNRWRKGRFFRDVNYDEIGPGYRSAYGLVAAYHIKQRFDEEGNLLGEHDNAIRTHGSVDYMSILRRFSHGCHRLYNMDAVRMFSFILRHRDFARHGQQPVGVRRTFVHEEEEYDLRIDSRGYKYELAEPIPVMVTEGRIRGRRKSPIVEYMKRPGAEEENVLEVDDGQGGTWVIPFLPPPEVAPTPAPTE